MPFASVAISQFIDYLPGWYWASNLSIHAIFRLPCGGGRSSGEYHSSMRLEAAFYHTPGLKMVHPSTPQDVVGLMRAALRDDSPILFFEDIWAYSEIIEKVSYESIIPIGEAALRKEGSDITIVSWGARTWFSAVLPAVKELEMAGYSIELIDLRSLAPLDIDLIVASAKKTHRVMIVHEDIKKGGIGQAIAADIQEAALDYLLVPISVVAAPFCPVPQQRVLEKEWYLPSSQKVIDSAKNILARS